MNKNTILEYTIVGILSLLILLLLKVKSNNDYNIDLNNSCEKFKMITKNIQLF